MAVATASYHTDIFNSLPGFEVAGPKFDAINGKSIITIMTHLFRKHKVENIVGLQLLHQHFKLQPGERLVEFNGASAPVALEEAQLSNITPSIWDISRNNHGAELYPLEFVLNSGNDNLDNASPWSTANFEKFVASNQSFFLEYHDLAKKHGVEGMFGFVRYPGDGFPGRVEINVGSTNINLTPAQVSDGLLT
jgi:hypothetical protein